MSLSSKQMFPTWYKSILPQITNELLDQRIAAINILVVNDSMDFWLDVIRIANGIKVKNAATTTLLVDEFLKTDVNFPPVSNENILKVLSSILLCFKLERQDDELIQPISLAIVNLNFLGQHEESTIPFANRANLFLQNDIIQDEDIEDDITILNEALDNFAEGEEETHPANSEYSAMIRAITVLNSQREKSAEEVNTLWWVLGEFSKSQNKFFIDIGSLGMIIPGAKELFDLTTYSRILLSAKALLQKVLIISNKGKHPSKATLLETVNATGSECKASLNNILSKASEFTPCLLATKVAIDSGTSDWEAAYRSVSANGNPKKKMEQGDISFQFYRELIFISSL